MQTDDLDIKGQGGAATRRVPNIRGQSQDFGYAKYLGSHAARIGQHGDAQGAWFGSRFGLGEYRKADATHTFTTVQNNAIVRIPILPFGMVITHAHVDHAGSAASLRALSGAPIVAHAGDLDYYLQKKPMRFCATGWFGRLFLRMGLILQPYTPFTPDVLLEEGAALDLTPYGLDGRVRHTPGHTAGSLSVQLAGWHRAYRPCDTATV
nr:MBL fold metallo-hydrolase [Rhodoferax sp.]